MDDSVYQLENDGRPAATAGFGTDIYIQEENAARPYTEKIIQEANRVPTREEDKEREEYLWKQYLSQTDKIDKAVVENWKGDADSILLFTGLFSATVGGFIIESYKGLQPDSGNTTTELLTQLVAFTIDGTRPTASIPPKFHAPTNSVWVNALWFCSLVLSLVCALGATLVQQWVRTYTQATQDEKSTARYRARSRVFMFNGVTRFYMPEVIRCIPILLHCALLFFFVGLVVFLRPIHVVVANIVLVIVCITGAVYSFFTLLPLVVKDSPYQTPLSPVIWRSLHILVLSISAWRTLLKKPVESFTNPARRLVEGTQRLTHRISTLFKENHPLVTLAYALGRFSEVTESMDAYRAKARLDRVRAEVIQYEEFGALAGTVYDIVTGSAEDPRLILDGASAFLRQHHTSYTKNDDKILKRHFSLSRPGHMIYTVVSVSASCRDDYREAFLQLLWELSTRYSYSKIQKPSPVRNVLARVAGRTGYPPWEKAISSYNRVVAITAVCIRAWTHYHALYDDFDVLSSLYDGLVPLLDALVPYYAQDQRVHRLLYPIIRAYAELLEEAFPKGTFPLRRQSEQVYAKHGTKFRAVWDAINARAQIHTSIMNAPVEVARDEGPTGTEPLQDDWKELSDCLLPFYHRIASSSPEDVRMDGMSPSATPSTHTDTHPDHGDESPTRGLDGRPGLLEGQATRASTPGLPSEIPEDAHVSIEMENISSISDEGGWDMGL